MDALTTAEVGLGSAALATALIQGLRGYGLATSQKLIFLWAMLISVGLQVLYVLSQGEAATMQNLATAVLAGITSGLAASGLHDHATAAAGSVKAAREAVKAANAIPATSPEEVWAKAHAILKDAVASGRLSRDQASSQANGQLNALHAVYPYTTIPKAGEVTF